jgi:hypothetical protein
MASLLGYTLDIAVSINNHNELMQLEKNIYHDQDLYERIKKIAWEQRISSRELIRAITNVYENDSDTRLKVEETIKSMRSEQPTFRKRKSGIST